MKKKDIYIQDDASSCGARCIQSIVSFYGGYVPLETVLEDTNTTITGTNALEIVLALEKYGFEANGYKVSFDELKDKNFPLIAHTVRECYEHFVVIYEINSENVITMDPEFGEKIYSNEEFKSIFDCTIITIRQLGEIPKFTRSTSLIKLLYSYLSDQSHEIKIVLLLSIVIILLSIIVSFHLKVISLYKNEVIITIFFVILELFTLTFKYVKDLLTQKIIRHIDEKSTINMLNHIFLLPIRYLKNKRVGEIVKKIEDIEFIKNLFVRITVVNILDIITLVVSLTIMLVLSWRLALIYVAATLIYCLISFITRRKIYINEKRNLKYYNDYSGTLVEYLNGIESIKNLNSEKIFLSKLEKSFKTYAIDNSLKSKTQISVTSLKQVTIEIGVLLANLYGFMSLTSGFTFVDLITYTSIFTIFFESIESILETFLYFIRGKAIYKNSCEFNDLPIEEGGIKLKDGLTKIKIEDLTYSYDRINLVLDKFNCSIKSGDKIFVKGPSGVGKSTFAKALVNGISNYDGKILINGFDIKDLSIRDLRERCIYVGQNESLFEGSFKENILLGSKINENYEKILYLTKVDEIIEAHGGNDEAIILEDGANLSGGEKARIILARALMKKPDLLIIDETLSSIPEVMEDEILDRIIKIKKMILVYISHRNKEKKFKKIIELKKGKKL